MSTVNNNVTTVIWNPASDDVELAAIQQRVDKMPARLHAEILPDVEMARRLGAGFSWASNNVFDGPVGMVYQGSKETGVTGLPGNIEVSGDHALFFAHAPTDIRYLLNLVQGLQQDVATERNARLLAESQVKELSSALWDYLPEEKEDDE